MNMPRLAWLLAAISVTSAFAGNTPFLITDRTSQLDGSIPAEAAMLQALNSAADMIQDTINNGFLAESNRQTFADGLAKANTSPTAGYIADRASNFSRFSVGAGVQGGFFWQGNGTSSNANNQLPQLGAGLQGGVTLGLKASALRSGNLGPIDPKRLGIFLSAMGGSTSFQSVHASLFNIGLNFQYELVSPKSLVVLGWSGLRFLTGFNYARSEISYSGNIKQNASTTVSGQTADIAIDMNYSIGARNSVFYVPIEMSTGVQLLYFLTLYGGGAADLNFGSSSLIGTGTGPISATASSSFGHTNVFSGTGSLQLDDGTDGHPSTVTMRAFAGAQMNFFMLKLDVQGSVMNNGAKAGTLMVRAAL